MNAQDRYAVFYKYKPQESLSLDAPSEFLSQKALDRRNREGVAVDSVDLPVAAKYEQEVKSISTYVLYSSKWFNASVVVAEEAAVSSIEALPFVDRVELVARGFSPLPNARVKSSLSPSFPVQIDTKGKVNKRKLAKNEEAYLFQNKLLGIDEMHEDGYTGKGIIISVFDAGFPGVDQASVFSHLHSNHQLIAAMDFVMPWETNALLGHSHGTKVLSLIAGYDPGKMVAGSYNASYFLAKTEEVPTEFKIEEFNWVRAAEVADSLGTDIISSSLGYVDFDDPEMTYSLEDMDGKTSYVSRAATMAADRGILVVNSAGNSGPKANSITAPADAYGILTIASVGKTSAVASSSSRGPTADGRIKPDLAAMGQQAALILANGAPGFSSGTSFSAPQITALAAGLWEARPDWTKDELIQSLLTSGSQADDPDNILGYGIPNFRKALYGEVLSVEDQFEEITWKVFPNPLDGEVLNIYFGNSLESEFMLTDLNGRTIRTIQVKRGAVKEPFRIELEGINSGVYILRMQDGAFIKHSKLYLR